MGGLIRDYLLFIGRVSQKRRIYMKNIKQFLGLMACITAIAFLLASCATVQSVLSTPSSSPEPTPTPASSDPVPVLSAYPTSWETAKEIQIGSNSEIFPQYGRSELRYQWYYVTVPAGTIRVRGEQQTSLTLYDVNRNQLVASVEPGNTSPDIRHQVIAGTYYIAVGRIRTPRMQFSLRVHMVE